MTEATKRPLTVQEWLDPARRAACFDDMLAALKAVAPLIIPGMNWTDETGELVKSMVRAAITKAEAGA